MRAATLNSNKLVDIRTVSVDKHLPRDMRIAEFIRQIKNPYRFKCGKFTVTAKYADSGLTLEDCILQMLI
jgi:RecJ-like exonuclease